MPMEYTYFKKYIILKNDYTNISHINPKGHAKAEVRGNKGIISLNVDNCEEDEQYRVYLVKEENGTIRQEDLGRIFTDDLGRCRTNITLNLRELESKGFSISEIDAILIRRGIYILLGGYIDKDNKVIDRLVKELISENEDVVDGGEVLDLHDEAPEAKEIEEELKEGLIEEEIIEEIVHKEEILDFPKPEQEEVEEEITEEIIKEEIIEEPDIDEPEVAKEVFAPQYEQEVEEVVEDTYRENYETLEYTRRLQHKNQMTNYILSILRFFPQVQPLKIYLHNYSWWRIEDDGTEPYRGFLPYYNYLMSSDYKYPFLHNSATCINQIRRYGHYLFGLYKEKQETKFYIYGVPGKFTPDEHPFKGVTGFNTWYDSIDGVGYWILYIDPITGKVIYPINPMVPSY